MARIAQEGSRSPARAALKRKSTWGESLLLWGKFSVAIMLAVGGAVVKGPGEMLRDADNRDVSNSWPQRKSKRCREVKNERELTRKNLDEAAFESRSRPHDIPDLGKRPRATGEQVFFGVHRLRERS